MDSVYYAFAVLIFAAAILLVEGASLWWIDTHGGGARRIPRRLRLVSDGPPPARAHRAHQGRVGGGLRPFGAQQPQVGTFHTQDGRGENEHRNPRRYAVDVGSW